LCFKGGFSNINIADIINLVCALCFAIQILFVDKFVKIVDGIKLSAMQLLTCGLISLVLSFIFEKPNINNILEVILPILFLGVFSSGIAYTLQIVGQKLSNNPTVDSILMSLETVFAVIGGSLILKEVLEINEIIGCVLIFVAIILAQIPIKIKKGEKENVQI
jgi:drug/metabolite transporter (DMT)-like permease